MLHEELDESDSKTVRILQLHRMRCVRQDVRLGAGEPVQQRAVCFSESRPQRVAVCAEHDERRLSDAARFGGSKVKIGRGGHLDVQ